MQQSTMKYSYLKTIIPLLATMISCIIYAQNTIHPGDANNNGQVEKTDFLFLYRENQGHCKLSYFQFFLFFRGF